MSSLRRAGQSAKLMRCADRSGFTLVEALVAFVVLATLMSVLFRGVVGLRAGAAAFDIRGHADVVARTLLDEALAKRDLAAGTTSGIRNGRRWTLKVSPVDLASQLPKPPVDQGADGPQPVGPQGANQQGASQQGLGQQGANPQGVNPQGAESTAAQPPTWKPQRLVVRVETEGTPVEVETIRLAKVP